MGRMRVLDGSGDTTIEWELADETSVAEAAELFLQLQGQRKVPFARPAGAPAAEATLVRDFDPTAEEIIWVRPVAGG